MHCRCIEDVELADIHGMFAAGLGEPDAAAEAEFAAFRVLAHAAAGGRGDDLDAPARSEDRRAGLERRAHQLDLPHHFGAGVVDVQAGAGDRYPVIALKRGAFRQQGCRVAGIANIHHGSGQQLAQQIGIAFACRNPTGRDVVGHCLRGIAFNDEQAGRGHRFRFQVR